MNKCNQVDHRTHSQLVYNEALETAMTDRDMLPDALLTHDSLQSDTPHEFAAVYDRYSWAAHSLKARSWLQAALVFNILLISFDYLVSPTLLVASLIVRGLIGTSVLLGAYILWGRQQARWVQGMTMIVVSVTIMLEAGFLGAMGGVFLFERYLTAGLFTVATAVLFFPIEFKWTIVAVTVAAALQLLMLAIGPVSEPLTAIIVSCFYCSAIASFATTRRATIRSQWKSFKSKIRELRDQEALAQLNAELKLVANLDPLTGLQNRRSAHDDMEKIWSEATDKNTSIAFLMLDIDDFKKINDTCGHAVGDECIKNVASRISDIVRDDDIVSRHGGEEFLVVLTKTNVTNAITVAERIRECIEAIRLVTQGDDTVLRVTVSIGLAFRVGAETPQMLINRADEALYLAKHKGKNQTVVSPSSDSTGPVS